MAIDSKLIILEDVGFNVEPDQHLDALEHVLSLKAFIQEKFPELAEITGFEDSFNEYPYDLLGNIEALSELADKHFGCLIVAI